MRMISLQVNGQRHTLDVDPTTPLLYVLSDDLALKGPKFGCGRSSATRRRLWLARARYDF